MSLHAQHSISSAFCMYGSELLGGLQPPPRSATDIHMWQLQVDIPFLIRISSPTTVDVLINTPIKIITSVRWHTIRA